MQKLTSGDLDRAATVVVPVRDLQPLDVGLPIDPSTAANSELSRMDFGRKATRPAISCSGSIAKHDFQVNAADFA